MSGLGKELVEIALKKWYKVDVLDISDGWIQNTNPRMSYKTCDISKIDDSFIDTLHWPYDMVICNAWISWSGNFTEQESRETAQIMHINTLWHIELVRILLEKNKISSRWSIACIASASEMLPFPIAVSYSASKWALSGFARALRSYLLGQKISVSVVYPGPMPTAHVKYYGKKISHDEASRRKVHSVAKKTFAWIEKRRRNIYPDITSKVLLVTSIFWPFLDWCMYRAYKKDIS